MPARKLIVLLLSLLTAASLSAAGSGTPRGSKAADVLEYAPALLPWAVKAAGGETRSGWARMGVSQAAGAAFTAGLVESLKLTVHETRPDGSDDRAFPSGHAAIAFMGATMIERELGWRSPWYTLGAYTFATGIAMERVIDRRHRPVDVIAGAHRHTRHTPWLYSRRCDIRIGSSGTHTAACDHRPRQHSVRIAGNSDAHTHVQAPCGHRMHNT